MTDFDPDRVTEVRTTIDPLGRPATEVTRTVVKSNTAAWWAMGLVGVALIAAVTYVITRQPAAPTNTDAAVAAATTQVHTQDAAQDAQTAAAQAQSAAAQAADRSSPAPAPIAQPATAPAPPVDAAPAQRDQNSSDSSESQAPPQ